MSGLAAGVLVTHKYPPLWPLSKILFVFFRDLESLGGKMVALNLVELMPPPKIERWFHHF